MFKIYNKFYLKIYFIWLFILPQLLVSQSLRFAAFGDFGDPTANGGTSEQAVADLVYSKNPDFILALGDNKYLSGSSTEAWDVVVGDFYSSYIKYPEGSTSAYASNGVTVNKFWPCLGNHDWDVGGQTEYFGLPGNERYYTFTEGPIEFFCIDSDIREPDGNDSTSIQAQWLHAQLTASTAIWKIVFFHEPAYSSGSSHGSALNMQWPFERWGADVAFSGHDHDYERVFRDDNNDGIIMPYFVDGLGGKSIYGFNTPIEGSQFRYASNYGAMIVDVTPTSINFEFWSIVNGGTLVDSYTMTKPSVTYCEDFNAFTTDQTVGLNPGWFDGGSGPLVGITSGVMGSQGLGSSGTFFTWLAQPFSWNASDFLGVQLQMDFKTDGNGQFHEARVGWVIDDSTANPKNIFGVQLDNAENHLRMESFWDHDLGDNAGRIEMVNLDTVVINSNTWYKFIVSITKQGISSAEINGELLSLDAQGNKDTLVTAGTINNSALVGTGLTPNTIYFADTLWPVYKNFTAGGNADNACLEVISSGHSLFPDAPANLITALVSSDKIKLNWTDNAINETGFEIERSNGGGSFVQIAVVPADITFYSDSLLNLATEYCYRVRAVNTFGYSDYTNSMCESTPVLAYKLIAPPNGSTVDTASPTLSVQVNNAESNNFTVKFHGRNTSAGGQSFTIIGLPDTQHYTSFQIGGLPAMFDAQTQWIIDNQAARNIVFVSHFGDITDDGDSNTQEWDYANNSMSKLESILLPEGIPYGVLPGNHDQIGGTVNYNSYFGVSRFSGKSFYGGHYGSTNNNNFELFSAGGMDFIIINLEYNVSADARTWADNILKTYSDRRAIVVSHSILNVGTPATFTAPGQAIYDDLKDNPNLFLMLCGHNHGEGYRTDTYNGNTVYSLIADYQDYPGGGNGFLRIMEFIPDSNEISIKTYSPYIDQWETDFDSQFTIPYDMTGSAPFEVIDSVTNVASGDTANIVWPGLDLMQNYEWYVSVNDGTSSDSSNVWNFETWLGANKFLLAVNIDGSGSVIKNPDKPYYDLNDTVQLTAVPSGAI